MGRVGHEDVVRRHLRHRAADRVALQPLHVRLAEGQAQQRLDRGRRRAEEEGPRERAVDRRRRRHERLDEAPHVVVGRRAAQGHAVSVVGRRRADRRALVRAPGPREQGQKPVRVAERAARAEREAVAPRPEERQLHAQEGLVAAEHAVAVDAVEEVAGRGLVPLLLEVEAEVEHARERHAVVAAFDLPRLRRAHAPALGLGEGPQRALEAPVDAVRERVGRRDVLEEPREIHDLRRQVAAALLRPGRDDGVRRLADAAGRELHGPLVEVVDVALTEGEALDHDARRRSLRRFRPGGGAMRGAEARRGEPGGSGPGRACPRRVASF